jgi:hypothetical protein
VVHEEVPRGEGVGVVAAVQQQRQHALAGLGRAGVEVLAERGAGVGRRGCVQRGRADEADGIGLG